MFVVLRRVGLWFDELYIALMELLGLVLCVGVLILVFSCEVLWFGL